MKDNRSLGGYALMGIAVLALAICIGAAARELMDWTIGAGIAAVLTAAVGSVWYTPSAGGLGVWRNRIRVKPSSMASAAHAAGTDSDVDTRDIAMAQSFWTGPIAGQLT